MNLKNSAAFSLLEILLASIIFIISVGGIFATLSAVRIPVAEKESALTAAVFGRQVLETLRTQVNASTFYNTCSATVNGACVDFSLYLGPHQVSQQTVNFYGLVWPSSLSVSNEINGNTTPTLSYTVSCGDSAALPAAPDLISCSSACVPGPTCNIDMARRVDLNINWPNAT